MISAMAISSQRFDDSTPKLTPVFHAMRKLR